MSRDRLRLGLGLVTGDPAGQDQVLRLARFRHVHPDVAITVEEFGNWQALIPEPDGERVIVRPLLKDLLDKLNELLP